MYGHLARRGMMANYKIWDLHGEVSNEPTMAELRRQFLSQRTSSISSVGPSVNPTVDILHDVFPYYAGYDADACDDPTNDGGPTFDDVVDDDYEKYDRLLQEAQTPLYPDSEETVLGAVLKAMELKVDNEWTDNSINRLCTYINGLLPKKHKFPLTYTRIKGILKDIGLGYQTIDACEYNCALFYKDNAKLDFCPKCHTSRWVSYEEGKNESKIARKVLRYFSLTLRLKRLYMSPHCKTVADPGFEVWVGLSLSIK